MPPHEPPLGYLLRQAAAAHRLKMDRALADIDITSPQFLILTLIDLNSGQSNADIARLAALTTPTVTVILANLVGRNLVTTSAHPVYKRVRLLALTELGKAKILGGRQRAEAIESELLYKMTSGEIRTIRNWLTNAADQRP